MEEIKLIKDIKDIVTKQDVDTISNKLMNAKVELNETRDFLRDATNCCTDDSDISLSCNMILKKHIEYLQYEVEMLKKMHTKLQNDMYGKLSNKTPELTSVSKKPGIKKEVSCYTSSDNVDMLI